MVHEEIKELGVLIENRKKITDQLILFDKVNIIGIPTDPWTPFFKTNNFFQRTLAHGLGFDATNEKFRLLQVDVDGNLKTTASVSQNLYVDVSGAAQIVKGNSLGSVRVDQFGRTFDNFDVFIDEPTGSLALLTSVGIDVRGYEFLSVNISSSINGTVTVQASDDNSNWYEMKNAADADLSWNVNNEKINFTIPNFSSFIRILFKNDTTSAGTTTVKLNAKA